MVMSSKLHINSVKCQSEDVKKTFLSNAHDRIRHMKPSAELVSYYEKKVDDLCQSITELEGQLEMCRKVSESNWFAQDELIKRNKEVSELTKAVSDLQVFLYQEREQVLHLSAENDKLRLLQIEYQKKLDTILSFAGLPKNFIKFICADPKWNNIVPRKGIQSNVVTRDTLKNGRKKLYDDIVGGEVEIEKLHVQALMAEWEEQSELYHDEIHSLLSDRDLRQKEWALEQERLQQQITNLNNILKSVQSNVCDDSDRLINMEKRHRGRENAWMEEKANLLKSLEAAHDTFHTVPHNSRFLKSQVSILKKQLLEKDKIVAMYKDQNNCLEEETERIKDELELNRLHNKEKSLKYFNQIKFFKQKCDDEKRRRLFEAEGFRNDIKFLRDRVQCLEKKVFSTASSE